MVSFLDVESVPRAISSLVLFIRLELIIMEGPYYGNSLDQRL